MTDLTNTSPLDPQPGPGAGRATPPRVPRWVRVAALVAGVLIVALLVLMATGLGGKHGPGRHLSVEPATVSSVVLAQPFSAGGQQRP